MDIFGIQISIVGRVHELFRNGRGTGRSTHLAKHTDSRHLIIFKNHKDEKDFKYKARDFHKSLQDLPASFVFDNFNNLHTLPRLCPHVLTHHVVFDHSWLETYYQLHLQQSINDLNTITDQSKLLLPSSDLKTIPSHKINNFMDDWDCAKDPYERGLKRYNRA